MSDAIDSKKFNEQLFQKGVKTLNQIPNRYLIERQYAAQKLKTFSVLLCGSPRVGKSELINALCGRKVAATSDSLDSCTKHVQCYSIRTHHKSSDGTIDADITTQFWDTPGIESWSEHDIRSYVNSIINKTQPICMLFCAKPGSFANLNHLKWLVKRCVRANIFCALICTNMYSNNRRNQVIHDFKKVLQPLGHGRYDHSTKITYFGKEALTMMVNSTYYYDVNLRISKDPVGIDELNFAILTSLNEEKIEGWINAILENRPFWKRMGHRAYGYFNETPSGRIIMGIIKGLCTIANIVEPIVPLI